MHRARAFLLFALAFSLFVPACSGNVVVEPGEQSSKRAKAFLAKCNPDTPADPTIKVKLVYACLPPEDVCPDLKDPSTAKELGYVLDKQSTCGTGTTVYDVPCGPDLNAVACCYAVRTQTSLQTCD